MPEVDMIDSFNFGNINIFVLIGVVDEGLQGWNIIYIDWVRPFGQLIEERGSLVKFAKPI